MTTAKTRRLNRDELRQSAARRRRNTNLTLIGAGVAIVALIAFVIYLNIRSQMPVGDEQSFPTLGNAHIPQGSTSPVEYNSTPPTSGPHYPGSAPWAAYNEPIRYEQLIHNLEDGGVVIYYQCEDGCPELYDQLRALVSPYLDAGRHVTLVRNDPAWTAEGGGAVYHKDMGARIALTAWQRMDTFDDFNAERIQSFIQRYEGIDHHGG